MRRLISFLWTALIACALICSHPAASTAAGQTGGQETTVKKKKKKKQEREEKEEGVEKPPDKKLKEPKDAGHPDRVPADEERELSEEFDALRDADYPDLVPADEESELMDEFALLMEEEIIFSAAKHKQDIAESPSAITVITREQIENTHCTDVVCLLRSVPEVDVYRVMPMYATTGARALTDPTYGDKVLVLVDGREINIGVFGMAFFQSLPILMEDIERIEVIRGPGSALYGANAHSMVVSIVTRKATKNAAEVFLGGGEHDRSLLHLRVDRLLGNFRLHLSGGYETEGHWMLRDRREREIKRIRLRLDHEAGASSSSLQLGLTLMDGGVLTGLAPGDLSNGFITHLSLSHQTEPILARLSGRLIGADFHLDLPLFYQGMKLGELPEFIHILNSELDSDVQLTWSPFDGNLLIAGGNYHWTFVRGKNNDPEISHEHRVGVFIHDEQRLMEELVLTVSVRLDYNSITPFTASPRLAAVWRFSESQLVRAAFGKAFRKPCFFNTVMHFTGVKAEPGFEEIEELFLRGIGNKKLGNENITVLEAGYRGRFLDGHLTVEGDVFYNMYRDTIHFYSEIKIDQWGVPDLKNTIMEFRNTGREADSLGGSVSLNYRFKEVFRLNANYTYRYSWYISDSDDASMIGKKGDRVSWEPAHLANLSFHYLPERGLRLGAAVHGSSSNEYTWTRDGSPFSESVRVSSPCRYFVSGFLAWRLNTSFGWFEVGVRAYNILNAAFRDLPTVVRPDGRELGSEPHGRRIFFFLRGTI